MTIAARRAKPAGPVGGPAVDAPSAKVRRPDRRSAQTIQKIVSAAQQVMQNHGTSNISAREVCEEAGISRGTLYRYFPSMEAVLEAVAQRLRSETDEELTAALAGCRTPNERFTAFLAYTMSNRETARAGQFLHVEPAFVLKYFENSFDHFIARVNGALESVYEAWEADLGAPLDREAISEMMVRYALSETLVPHREGRPPLAMRLRAMVDLVMAKHLPAPASRAGARGA